MSFLGFDPARPLVAVSRFRAGEAVIEAGDAFDWRARELTELDALTLFQSGFVTHPPIDAAFDVSDAPAANVTLGETVSVETPAQRRGKRR